jgi:hypothetical protein
MLQHFDSDFFDSDFFDSDFLDSDFFDSDFFDSDFFDSDFFDSDFFYLDFFDSDSRPWKTITRARPPSGTPWVRGTGHTAGRFRGEGSEVVGPVPVVGPGVPGPGMIPGQRCSE